MPRRKELFIPDAVLDQPLSGADPKTVFDPNGLFDALKKALAERVLNAEMDHHLAGAEPGNRRNGYGKKTVMTDTGPIELEVPRDRQARFDPQLIAKYPLRGSLVTTFTRILNLPLVGRCTTNQSYVTGEPPFLLAVDRWKVMTVGNARSATSRI